MLISRRRRRRDGSGGGATSADHVVFSTQPVGANSGSALATQPVVTAKKADGTTDTSYVGTVTVAINTVSGSHSLGGTTSKACVAGVATFTDLVDTGSGDATLSATSPGLAGATSASFTTAAGATNYALAFASGETGTAPNDSSIAAASALAFAMRIKGDKLAAAAGLGAGALTNLLEVYKPAPSAASKFMVKFQADGAGGVQIYWQDPALGGLTPATYYPGASINTAAYYVLYIHEDAAQTNRQYAALYQETSPGVVDTTPVWTGFRTNTYITGLLTTAGYGAVILNNVATVAGTATAGTYDWFAIFSAAQSGAAQYTKPATNAAALLALWEFNEGTGTTAANSATPTGTAQAMTVPNHWVSA